MNRDEAIQIDDAFYAEWDEESAMWCAFGNQSGFAYGSYADEVSAQRKADKLEENYAKRTANSTSPAAS